MPSGRRRRPARSGRARRGARVGAASRGRAGEARARSGRALPASRDRGCAHPWPRLPPAARGATCGRTIRHPRRAAALLDHAGRHPPVRGTTVAGRREKPAVEPGGGGRRLGDERCPGPIGDRARATLVHDGCTPPTTTAATAPTTTTRRHPVREANPWPDGAAATWSTTASAASPTSSHANRCPSRWAVCSVAPAVVSAFERDASATPRAAGRAPHREGRPHAACSRSGRRARRARRKREQRPSAVGEVEADAKGDGCRCRDGRPERRPAESRLRRRSRGPRRPGGPSAFQYPIGFAS